MECRNAHDHTMVKKGGKAIGKIQLNYFTPFKATRLCMG